MRNRVGVVAVSAAIGMLALPGGALAAAGDVFVADQQTGGGGNGAVVRVGPAGGAATGIFQIADFRNPTGLTQLPDGRVLVADLSAVPSPGIFELNPATGVVSPFKTGAPFVAPRDIARGPDGMLYVTDPGTDSIHKLDPLTRNVTTFANLPATSAAEGIAVARNGTIYVTSRGIPRSVLRVDAGGGVATFATDILISDPVKAILNPDESLLILADVGSGGILRISTANAGVSKLATVADPHGVALLPTSEVLATNNSANSIDRVPASGSPVSPFSTDPAFNFPDDIVVEPSKCGGLLPTVVGTTGPDILSGSPFGDIIAGLQGKDRLIGLGGNDIICGDAGKDVLKGGPGKDRLLGGKGKDKLSGGKGKDTCKGNAGKDKGKSCEKGKL